MSLHEFVQRDLVSIGGITTGGEKILDVQQRKSEATNLVLVAVLPHGPEHHLFVDRIVVLVSQQRGDRGGTATEIILLLYGAAETAFLQALHGRHIDAAKTTRNPYRTGMGGSAEKRHRQPRQTIWQEPALYQTAITTAPVR